MLSNVRWYSRMIVRNHIFSSATLSLLLRYKFPYKKTIDMSWPVHPEHRTRGNWSNGEQGEATLCV